MLSLTKPAVAWASFLAYKSENGINDLLVRKQVSKSPKLSKYFFDINVGNLLTAQSVFMESGQMLLTSFCQTLIPERVQADVHHYIWQWQQYIYSTPYLLMRHDVVIIPYTNCWLSLLFVPLLLLLIFCWFLCSDINLILLNSGGVPLQLISQYRHKKKKETEITVFPTSLK